MLLVESLGEPAARIATNDMYCNQLHLPTPAVDPGNKVSDLIRRDDRCSEDGDLGKATDAEDEMEHRVNPEQMYSRRRR